jgi:hypothetical protein
MDIEKRAQSAYAAYAASILTETKRVIHPWYLLPLAEKLAWQAATMDIINGEVWETTA